MTSLGTKVRLSKHPQRPKGTITYIDWTTDKIIVTWDDMDLIPPTQEYPIAYFSDGTFEILNEEFKFKGVGKCECGAKFDRDAPDEHYPWCQLFTKRN